RHHAHSAARRWSSRSQDGSDRRRGHCARTRSKSRSSGARSVATSPSSSQRDQHSPGDGQINAADNRLDRLCQQEPVIQLLMTAPGVGSVVAATFVSVIDEAGRFRRAHQLESYLGLVPSENTSGGAKQRLGHITKQGNSYLRALLVQSACAIMQNGDKADPLVIWAKEIADRRGKKIAIIALARRLAGVLWAMWRKHATYEPSNINVKKARLLRRRQPTEVTAASA